MLASIVIFFTLIPSVFFAVPVKTAHVELELISEVKSIEPGKPFWLGIRFDLAKDWHIYWRNPGDAGMAPKFKWDLPQNFSLGIIQWPYPIRIVNSGLASFVYEDKVMLLVKIIPPEEMLAGSDVLIRVHIDWLECKDVCIPGKADLTLSLPVNAEDLYYDARWKHIFNDTRSKIPVTDSNWQVKTALEDSNIVLIANSPAEFKSDIASIEFFPFSSDIFINAKEQNLYKDEKRYRLNLPLSPSLLQIPERLSGILVADKGWMGAKSAKAIIIDLPIRKNTK